MTENGTLDIFGGGNIETPPSIKKNRKYCFTLNNYSEQDVEHLKNGVFYNFIIFGKEIAPTTGTKHLQGYIELPNARFMKGLTKDMPRCSFKDARGTAEQNITYCSKGTEIFTWGTPIPTHGGKREKSISFREQLKINCLKEFESVDWKLWQAGILSMLAETADKRKINWYWDDKGNIGKSFLAKYIVCAYDGVIICDGKKENIFNQVNSDIDNDIEPKICILDITRTLEGKIHMGTIEALKNGCLYSGKYEGGKCVFTPPHVFAFANFPPKLDDLSADRWNVVDLSMSKSKTG